jgi:hypothetical protein
MTRASGFYMALACAGVVFGAAQIVPRAEMVTSRYLFVWAGDWDRHDSDFLAVLDIRPAPGRYGRVVATVPVGEAGLMPHHTEHEFGSTGTLFANGFAGNRTFLFNMKDPLKPQIVQRFSGVNGLSFLHSFSRLPNGHVLATFQGHGPENQVPGGIAELDDTGAVVRSASAADPNAHQQETMRPYSLAVVPALDRVVVGLTAMGIPTWSAMHDVSEHLDHAGDQIQVWRLSDLTVIKTVELPKTESGMPERAPSEPRVLADGKTVVVMTMGCGLYRVTGLEGGDPSAELVYHPGMTGCGVPVVVGSYWMMPVSSGHRVLSIDMSDLAHVHDVSTLQLNNRQTPHWLSSDGSRMVVINAAGSPEHRIWMANVDARTGALSFDEAFRDEGASGAGFDFDRASWPHGPTGDASPHGTVFVR